MSSEVQRVTIKGVMPTSNGCAIFLGPEDKTFIIYVDPHIGSAITMIINREQPERPLTHDLIANMLVGLGTSLERVVINAVKDRTFYARIILKMENELGTKIVEVDARPSDAIAMAQHDGKPIFASQAVIDAEDDMTELLERIQKDQA
jgi:bifunctional DNase/RNase